MANMNRAPEVRDAGSSKVCNMGLAVSEKWKSKDGAEQESVCFVDVECWGRQAETCAEYLDKGSPVLIDGRLKFDSWEKDGQKRSRLSVRADRVQFLGKPRNQPDSDDDLPATRAAAKESTGAADDLPF